MLHAFSLLAALGPQVGPFELLNSSVGHTQRHVEVGDLDHDGRPDLVTTSSIDQRIVLYRGLGGGQFDIGRELSRDVNGFFPALIRDLDGDGRNDLVFSLVTGLAWRRGLAGGVLGDPAPVAGVLGIDVHSVLDLDRDGLLDLVLLDFNTVRVQWGVAPSQFAAPVTVLTTNTSVDGVVAADLDGDGRLDLAVAEPFETFYPGPVIVDGRLRSILQLAPRSFGGAVVHAAGQFRTTALVALDADSDGDVDLVRADAGTGALFLSRNAGGNTFQPGGAPLAVRPGLTTLVRADHDGDGDDDLLFASEGQPSNRLVGELRQQAGGVFTAGATLADVGTNPRGVVSADLDLDGRADLVHISVFDDRLIWHRALASGGYAPPVELTDRFALSSTGEAQFAVEDLDGDGGLDIVALFGTVRVAEERPDGAFARSVATPVRAPVLGFPELADLDGDGDLDLLMVQWTAPTFQYELEWAPRIPGGFGAAIPIDTQPSSNNLNGPRALDWDGDGDLDVVVAGYQSGQVRVHINAGAGAFAPGVVVAQHPNLALLPPADIDGDGLPDLVFQSLNLPGARTFVRRRSAPGQLGPAQEIGALVGALRDFAWADLDGDGDLDALRVESASSSALGGDVALYENRGALGFGPRTVLIPDPIIGAYLRVQPIDWDVDGRQDVLVLDQSRRRIDVYLQTGPLQLGPRQELAAGFNQGNGLRVVDLDRDGDQDLVLADSGIQALRGYKNRRSVGQVFCASLPNSTGAVAGLSAAGSDVVAVDRTTLTAHGLPQAAFGYFLTSLTPAPTPVGGLNDGLLCLGGSIGRYNRAGEVRSSGALGRFSLALALGDTPTPLGSVAVVPGQTWHYQAWYRDANPGVTSNFTDGLAVQFR